jgi:F-type H+-transporting ATPase subunit b
MRLISLMMLAMLSITPVVSAATHEDTATPFAGHIWQTLATLIIFGLLLAILAKYAWGPILKGLVDREEKIKNDLEQAEIAAREATATLEQYRRQLTEAHAEARKIIEQGRSDAQKIAANLQKQAEADLNGLRTRAEAEITSAKQQAVSELYSQAATLATSVAGRILQRELKPEDQQRLVEESLAALSKSSNN